MDRLSDKLTCGTIKVLVHTLLFPKVLFEDSECRRAYAGEPSILVSNHTCHIDGGLLNVVFGRNKVHSLAAKDRFEEKWFGLLLRHTYSIPIDRRHPSTAWIHAALKVLKEDGDCVAIYPEGRHGQHRRQLPFHSGVTLLAITAGVPVIPVYMDGPFRLFHRAGVMIGKPMTFTPPATGSSSDYIREQTEVLQQKIKALQDLYVERTSK